MTELLATADRDVLPAMWHEPFGRVVIESMAAGVPVIASNRGGIPGDSGGKLVEIPGRIPDDADSMAAAITKFGDWRANEPDLGKLCRSYVAAKLT